MESFNNWKTFLVPEGVNQGVSSNIFNRFLPRPSVCVGLQAFGEVPETNENYTILVETFWKDVMTKNRTVPQEDLYDHLIHVCENVYRGECAGHQSMFELACPELEVSPNAMYVLRVSEFLDLVRRITLPYLREAHMKFTGELKVFLIDCCLESDAGANVENLCKLIRDHLLTFISRSASYSDDHFLKGCKSIVLSMSLVIFYSKWLGVCNSPLHDAMKSTPLSQIDPSRFGEQASQHKFALVDAFQSDNSSEPWLVMNDIIQHYSEITGKICKQMEHQLNPKRPESKKGVLRRICLCGEIDDSKRCEKKDECKTHVYLGCGAPESGVVQLVDDSGRQKYVLGPRNETRNGDKIEYEWIVSDVDESKCTVSFSIPSHNVVNHDEIRCSCKSYSLHLYCHHVLFVYSASRSDSENERILFGKDLFTSYWQVSAGGCYRHRNYRCLFPSSDAQSQNQQKHNLLNHSSHVSIGDYFLNLDPLKEKELCAAAFLRILRDANFTKPSHNLQQAEAQRVSEGFILFLKALDHFSRTSLIG